MTAAPAQATSSSTPSMRIVPCAVPAWIVVTSAAFGREPIDARSTMRTEKRIGPRGATHLGPLTSDLFHDRDLHESVRSRS